MVATVSISDLTQQCLQKFQDAKIGKKDTENHDHLDSRLGGFNLWVDNVGALAKSGASLDSRFKSRPDDRDLVRNILSLLSTFLDEYVDIVDKGHPTTDALVNIDSAIRNLAKIGVAIRRTGKASRSRRANNSFNPDEHQDFKRHLKCLILLRPKEDQSQLAGLEISSINELIDPISDDSSEKNEILNTKLEQLAKSRMEDLDSSKLTEIQKRLIDANLRRRHNFLLAQKRSQRVKKTAQLKLTADKQQLDIVTPSAVLVADQGKIPASLEPKDKPIKSKAPPTVTGHTIASTAEGTLQFNPNKAQHGAPTIARSQISFIAANTEFPKPPSSSQSQLVFKCPCCCQSLPSEDFTSASRWRQHLIEDLCPYTCIAQSCPTPDMLFTTRKAWEAHVENDHPSQWQCLLCGEDDEPYSSEEDLTAHTQNEHREALLKYELSFLLSSAEVRCMGIESCPLCSSYGPRDSPELVDHAVRHAYEFALRALPWPKSVIEDLNKPIGTFSLPEGTFNAEKLEKWLATLQESAKELEISSFDTMDHALQESDSGGLIEDYFASNDYFEDEQTIASSKRQTGQARSSIIWTESSEERAAHEVLEAAAIAEEEAEIVRLLKKQDEKGLTFTERLKLDELEARAKQRAVTYKGEEKVSFEAEQAAKEAAIIEAEKAELDALQRKEATQGQLTQKEATHLAHLKHKVAKWMVEQDARKDDLTANASQDSDDNGDEMSDHHPAVENYVTYKVELDAAATRGDENAVCALIEDCGVFDGNGEIRKEALMTAASSGHMAVAKQLLGSGVDINSQNEKGWTALFFATARKDISMVQHLIESGIDVNIKDHDGLTALHIALQQDDEEIISALFTLKVYVKLATGQVQGAISWAKKQRHRSAASALSQLEKKYEEMIRSIQENFGFEDAIAAAQTILPGNGWYACINPWIEPLHFDLVDTLQMECSLFDLAYSQDGKYIAVGGHGGRVRIFDVEARQNMRDVRLEEGSVVENVCFSPDGQSLFIENGELVQAWDITTGTIQNSFEHNSDVLALDASSDGRLLACGDESGVVHIWDLEQRIKVKTFTSKNGQIYDVKISPDSSFVAAGNEEDSACIWSLKTDAEERKFDHGGYISSIAFSSDGRYLATAGNPVLELWDLDTGARISNFEDAKREATSVSMTPDDRWIATAHIDGSVWIWDRTTGEGHCIFDAHKDDIHSIAFSPQGSYFATASRDETLRIWSYGPRRQP